MLVGSNLLLRIDLIVSIDGEYSSPESSKCMPTGPNISNLRRDLDRIGLSKLRNDLHIHFLLY
jgi:hypothetical protein